MDHADYNYVLVFEDKVVGVKKETSSILEVDILCARHGQGSVNSSEELAKNKVIKDLHREKVEFIEEIPSWWLSSNAET